MTYCHQTFNSLVVDSVCKTGILYYVQVLQYNNTNIFIHKIFMMGQERQNRITLSRLKVKNIYATLVVDSVQKAEMVFCSNYIMRV